MNAKLLFLSAEASYYSLSRKLLLLVFPVSSNPLYHVNPPLFSIREPPIILKREGQPCYFQQVKYFIIPCQGGLLIYSVSGKHLIREPLFLRTLLL